MPIWKKLGQSLELHLKIEDIISEGDIIAVRYTESGTSVGQFFDKPPTGKTYELVAM